MSQWVAYAKLQQDWGKPEERKFPRFRAEQFNCKKGVVVDFSATGLRIAYKKDMKLQPGEIAELELCSPKGIVRCRAQVVWARARSRKLYEAGFRFMDEETHKQIRLFERAYDPLSEGMLDR